jgi:uncharacterized protein YggE
MKEHKPLLWAATAAFVVLTIFLAVQANRTYSAATTTNTVSFSGEGKVLAKPDVGVVSLSIVTEAVTSKQAQDDNSNKSNELIHFLRDEGIDEKDIKTTSYNIHPTYTYPRYAQPKISGYRVTQSIQVKIRNLDNVDAILDGVVAKGVNQVNTLQLTVDDPEELQNEARELAIKDAKKKAKELKGQLGIKLGKIINFSENTGGYTPVPRYAYESADLGIGGGGGPSIPVGENEIVVNVTITYQIK